MTGEQCPISPTPSNAGGQIDASVGKDGKQKLRFTFTPVNGTGKLKAPCAFIELSKQAVTKPNMDETLACRRCMRAVRLQSTT